MTKDKFDESETLCYSISKSYFILSFHGGETVSTGMVFAKKRAADSGAALTTWKKYNC